MLFAMLEFTDVSEETRQRAILILGKDIPIDWRDDPDAKDEIEALVFALEPRLGMISDEDAPAYERIYRAAEAIRGSDK